MRLRECKRQIASVVAIAAIAAATVAVVVADGVGINGCVPSASAPEVHVLPGRGWQRCARGSCGVFPRGRRRGWNDEDLEVLVSTNNPRSCVSKVTQIYVCKKSTKISVRKNHKLSDQKIFFFSRSSAFPQPPDLER